MVPSAAVRRAWPLVAFIAACGADERQVGGGLPSQGEASEPADPGGGGGGQGEGEGEAVAIPPTPAPGQGEGEDLGAGDPDPSVYVGCPPGQGSDHNGCRPLPRGNASGECASEVRAAISGALAFEDLDAVVEWGPVPGRASAEQRILVLAGTVTGLRPGYVEITEEGGEGRVVALDPATAPGEVLPVSRGDLVELEFREFRETIVSRSGATELRTDHSFLMRLAGRPQDGARYGPLLYALGDPLLPPRRAQNLENLGITMLSNEVQPCAFVDVSDAVTPVGLCRIYRRAAAYRFGETGKSAMVLAGQSGEFQEDARIYRVDSGDTHHVEDSHDDCNVPPSSEFRLTYMRPAPAQ